MKDLVFAEKIIDLIIDAHTKFGLYIDLDKNLNVRDVIANDGYSAKNKREIKNLYFPAMKKRKKEFCIFFKM